MKKKRPLFEKDVKKHPFTARFDDEAFKLLLHTRKNTSKSINKILDRLIKTYLSY